MPLYNIVLNAAIRRLFFTSLTALIVVWMNPSAFETHAKWVLAIVFTDILAYTMGTIYGINELLKTIKDSLDNISGTPDESDKIGGEGDRHEE